MVEEQGLVFEPRVCEHVVAALDVGNHVILTGPPGTGKTSLAYLAAELGKQSVRCTGFQPVTATSDWTTDITIGRYERSEEGRIFQPGVFLEAIESGRWLVVDELNRSDFDRAFGQLFTVLAGQSVTLPFHQKGSQRSVALVPYGAEPPEGVDIISIPHTWRMLATMNEVDKDLLHRLSYALMRRFAFIEVSSPSTPEFLRLLEGRAGGDVITPLLAMRSVRDLGPAIFLDASRFAAHRVRDGRSPSVIRYEAFCSYILPQLDRCTDAEAKMLFEALAPAFEDEELHALRRTVRAITAHGRGGMGARDADSHAMPTGTGEPGGG
jgi:DNA polymerase III delta prime subunit